MNKERRASIRDIIGRLRGILLDIQYVCSSEQDAIDNTPENLQYTDRFDTMENNVSNMEDAISSIDDAIDYLNNVD